MGNSTSDATITVLCKCQNEMKSTTPGDIYQRRIRCCHCDSSMPHAAVMFHCSQKNNYHKNAYDLCEECAKKKALKVSCQNCHKIRMNKILINNKHKHSQCNQCNKYVQRSKSNKYIYQCQICNNYIICIKCAKNPHIMQHEQQEYINKINNFNNNGSNQQIMTTLHGYEMVGPYTPDKNMVWYCDYKHCQYTKHGLYRKYRIQNWRSSKFGKKYVLCDGCVRQYQKQDPVVIVPPQVINVEVNINPNQNINQIPNNQVFQRSDTQIIQNQPEGVIDRTMTYM